MIQCVCVCVCVCVGGGGEQFTSSKQYCAVKVGLITPQQGIDNGMGCQYAYSTNDTLPLSKHELKQCT